jgi:hypothetical protein
MCPFPSICFITPGSGHPSLKFSCISAGRCPEVASDLSEAESEVVGVTFLPPS